MSYILRYVAVERARCCLALVAWIAALVAPTAALAQTPAVESAAHTGNYALVDDSLRSAIDGAVLAEMERQELVGVAVGVIRGGEIVYTAGYGFADRENEVPVDAAGTLFRWASISKPLTAIAAVQLARAGELDLDADVREYVPEFPEKEYEGDAVTITTRQLLAHLGGVVHYRNGPVLRTERAYEVENPFESVILALDTFKESPLVCAPGEKHSYTTHGYILASAVVERSGEQKFAEQVRERIVEPLGMTTLRPDYQWEEIPGRAVGYRRSVVGVIRSTDTDVSWKLGGGGFISNVEDLARLAAGLIGDDLLDVEMKEMMWTGAVTSGGETTSYGLGFSVDEENGRLKVAHSGAQEKTRTRLVIYPDDGHGVVVMTNSEHGNPGAITTAVYRAINGVRAGDQ